MLVLTRKTNQQIRLGNDITVTILRVKGNSIRIGIEAPRDVRVVRGELEAIGGQATDLVATGQAGDDGLEAFELELDGVDAEELEVVQNHSNIENGPSNSQSKARIYQMRAAAPLAGFLPPTARESAASYSI